MAWKFLYIKTICGLYMQTFSHQSGR